ncbi:hypothetical protein C1631_003290 [Chryseobacterium phosphatilyticum]|uniref:Uncharacterized protein n=1 Tax=Chryseobacterium phosphatilyticum TaxID=475075 RepID=A0A316XEM9_9FLAO|nr:hypothetical protein [Chryseobacterium phosphatilyticum]PWN71659.1 hypothetical protein C1631_003290 [Chryseobacterium phosphatilyticum]
MPQITTYNVDPAKRRVLTIENMEELGITDELIMEILNKKIPELKYYKVDEKGNYIIEKGDYVPLWPVGISINDRKFGKFPDPNAAQRGWMAFFEIGAPLFEERSNIIQPVADVISTRNYENRSAEARQFSDTIEFTIGNTFNWSLSGTGSLTFGGKVEGELQAQIFQTIEKTLQESLANSLTTRKNHKDHNHKDNIGTEEESEVQQRTEFISTNSSMVNFRATGTAIGRGELHAEVGLSLTGTISGTLTTSWNSSSNVSGNIPSNSRVETLATQRRQVKQFTYEVPITFSGFIGLNFDGLVRPNEKSGEARPAPNTPAKEIPVDISVLALSDKDRLYRAKGIAETVSTLDVNHTIFDTKPLNRDGSETFARNRPHNL